MKPLSIGLENHNSSLKVLQGQQVLLELPENPTTGYLWEVIDQEGIDVNSSYELSSGDAVGSGGCRLFEIACFQAGEYRLALRHHRPWEAADAETQEFVIHLLVSETQ